MTLNLKPGSQARFPPRRLLVEENRLSSTSLGLCIFQVRVSGSGFRISGFGSTPLLAPQVACGGQPRAVGESCRAAGFEKDCDDTFLLFGNNLVMSFDRSLINFIVYNIAIKRYRILCAEHQRLTENILRQRISAGCSWRITARCRRKLSRCRPSRQNAIFRLPLLLITSPDIANCMGARSAKGS